MARRPRSRRTVPGKASSWHKDPEDAIIEEPSKEVQELLDAVNAGISKEQIYTPSGPVQMQALQHDGVYKTTPVAGDTEMTFSGVRMGKRGKLIFEFSPVEPGDFKQLEMDESKVFGAFHELERWAKNALGATDTQIVAHSFSELAGAFMRSSKKRDEDAALKAQQDSERKERDSYAGNPNWGLF